MNADVITAIVAGVPAILAAVTALIVAIKAHGKATDATTTVTNAKADILSHLTTQAANPPETDKLN